MPPPTVVSPAEPSSQASPATPAPTAPGPKVDARAFRFDGFQLGDAYGRSVMSRPPYDQPCDDDPIDKRARRFMVYGAKPCRERTFPEATTVMFYLRYKDGAGELEQPIEAFGWLGGNYFGSRSDFPLRVGESAERATEVLGSPTQSFELSRKESRVLVQGHPGDIYVIVDGGRLAGFVVGPMPDDADNEQWRGLMQMYQRYTDSPTGP